METEPTDQIRNLLTALNTAGSKGVPRTDLEQVLRLTSLQAVLDRALQFAWGHGLRSSDAFTWKQQDGVVYFAGPKVKFLLDKLGPQPAGWPSGELIRSTRTDRGISVKTLSHELDVQTMMLTRVECHNLLIPPAWIPTLTKLGLLSNTLAGSQIPSTHTGAQIRSLRRARGVDAGDMAYALKVKPIVVTYVEEFDLPAPSDWSDWIDKQPRRSSEKAPTTRDPAQKPEASKPTVPPASQPKATPSNNAPPKPPSLRRQEELQLVDKIKKLMRANPSYNLYDMMVSLGHAGTPGDQRRFRLAAWTATEQLKTKGHFVIGPRKGERAGQHTRLEGDEGVILVLEQVKRRLAKQQRAMARVQADVSNIPKMLKSKPESDRVQRFVEKQKARIAQIVNPK